MSFLKPASSRVGTPRCLASSNRDEGLSLGKRRRRAHLRNVSFHLDLPFPVAGLRNRVCGLHSKQRVHLRAEGLLNPQCHVRRQRCSAVEEGGERWSGHAKNLGGLGNREIKWLNNFSLLFALVLGCSGRPQPSPPSEGEGEGEGEG